MSYQKEKAILSSKMAAFLVLSGCRVKRSKPDLKDSTKQVYYFMQNEHLDKMMNEYQNVRTKLSRIESEISAANSL